MGPLADFRSHMMQGGNNPRAIKLKWIDNMEDNKSILRTNNSEDDLVCKIEADHVPLADNHRRLDKRASKSTIKPFKQTMADVTGVPTVLELESEAIFKASPKQGYASGRAGKNSGGQHAIDN